MSPREKIIGQIRRGAAGARARLETVLLGLRELPPGMDRGPLAARITAALDALARLLEMDPEHEAFFSTIDAALAAVAEAEREIAPLGEAAPVVRAGDRLRTTRERLAALREASVDTLVALLSDRRLMHRDVAQAAAILAPFRASVGVPAEHAALRAPPRVLVELYPKSAHEAIDDSEDVLEEPAPDLPALPRSPEEALFVEHARAMARDCLHEMASLHVLRQPRPETSWLHGEPFERRLLANLDALVALAVEPHGLPEAFNVFEEVQRYARQAPVVDPGREFARALTFASTRGDPALRGAVLALKQAHPATLPAQQLALCLARHRHTAPMMRELLGEKDPRLVGLAIEVLRFLREARVQDLSPLAAHPAPGVRAAALRALGFVQERQAGAELLVEVLSDEDDAQAALGAAEGLVRLGRIEGLGWARDTLDAPATPASTVARRGALRLVAIAGDEGDKLRVAKALGVAPEEAHLAGLYGHPALVVPLIETLAAANRLRRSTGPWTHPLEIAASAALVRVTGVLLRDEPREVVDYDFANGPTLFAETWRGFWEEKRGTLAGGGAKLRWGRPYLPAATVAELGEPIPAALRDDLALELAVGLGDQGFEPGDWVARQRGVLAACEKRLEGLSYPAGAFLAAALGRAPRAG